MEQIVLDKFLIKSAVDCLVAHRVSRKRAKGLDGDFLLFDC